MKIAMITGATSGFGEETAKQLAEIGYNVIGTGRRNDRLELLKKEIETRYKVEFLPLCFDVRKPKEVEKSILTLPEKWKNIDILVNNAGLASGLGSIQDGNIDDWDKMIDTNVKGLLYVSKFVIPMMIKLQKGHIVNIGSIAGKQVYENGNVYCATKHALDALTKSMRIELYKHNIKVTAIHPGMAETEFSLVRFNGDETRAKKVYEGLEALQAPDIADAIKYVVTRPHHVNISDMLIMPTNQADMNNILRKNK